MLRYHALAGTQINRTIEGLAAALEGELKNIEGETLFEVEGPVEAGRAIVGGPFRTREGIEFFKRKDEKKPSTTRRRRTRRSRGRSRNQ